MALRQGRANVLMSGCLFLCLVFFKSSIISENIISESRSEYLSENPYDNVMIEHFPDPQYMPNAYLIKRTLDEDKISVLKILSQNEKLDQALQSANIEKLKWRHLLSKAQKYSWRIQDDLANVKEQGKLLN